MPESGSLPQTASRAIAKPQRPRHTEIKSTVRTATPLNQVRVQAGLREQQGDNGPDRPPACKCETKGCTSHRIASPPMTS